MPFWAPRMKNVATLTVKVSEVCPHTLTHDIMEQTIILTEDVKTGLRRRICDLGRYREIISHRADLTHWFAGGALPPDARAIPASPGQT